jgi:hypothetical protein
MPLAAGRHQLAHRQQLQHFEPRHLGLAPRQVLPPKLLQVQFIPQPATQPAITENPWTFQAQFGKLHFEPVENLGRNVAVLGEEANLLGQLINLIEDFEAFAPGRLLRVVDLTQV